jgi:hypothetical protein
MWLGSLFGFLGFSGFQTLVTEYEIAEGAYYL